MIKYGLLAFFWLLVSPVLFAQDEHQKQVGFGAHVYYSTVFWTESEAPVDSLNSLDRGLAGINPQLWFTMEWKRYSVFQIGLQYNTTGFQRRASDIQYGVVYHPDIPKRTDNLQGDPRHIDFIYRAHYIGLPIFWNREIIALRKTISLHYFFTPGISFGFLVYDKTIAKTRGFGYDGKNRFAVNNIYEGNPFSMQLHLGGRVEYMVDGKYRAHLQPVLTLPVTSVFKGGHKAYVPYAGVNVILTRVLGKEAVTD
jgi:hypothetical protein